MPADDLDILATYQRTGDPEAFRALVDRHQRLVFSAVRRILADSAWVEDTVQETFLRLAGFRQRIGTSLGSWLHRVATHLAVDRQRSERSRSRRERTVAVDSVPVVPEEDLLEDQRRLLASLDAAIDRLDDEDRGLVVDHFLNHLPQSVLAERLGISRQAVQQRLQRLLAQLRTTLRSGATISPALFATVLQAAGDGCTPPPELAAQVMRIAVAGIGRQEAVHSGSPWAYWVVPILVTGLLAGLGWWAWRSSDHTSATPLPVTGPIVAGSAWQGRALVPTTSAVAAQPAIVDGHWRVPDMTTWHLSRADGTRLWLAPGADLRDRDGGLRLETGYLRVETPVMLTLHLAAGRSCSIRGTAAVCIDQDQCLVECLTGTVDLSGFVPAQQLEARTALFRSGSRERLIRPGDNLWNINGTMVGGTAEVRPDSVVLTPKPGVRDLQLTMPELPPLSAVDAEVRLAFLTNLQRVTYCSYTSDNPVLPGNGSAGPAPAMNCRLALRLTVEADAHQGLLTVSHGTVDQRGIRVYGIRPRWGERITFTCSGPVTLTRTAAVYSPR